MRRRSDASNSTNKTVVVTVVFDVFDVLCACVYCVCTCVFRADLLKFSVADILNVTVYYNNNNFYNYYYSKWYHPFRGRNYY